MTIPFVNSASAQSVANGRQGESFVVKEGQMIHGQIKQLYPGQTAEIQIGSQKMIAKLEVPMKAGDAYYFQVSAVKPDLQLKVISGPTGAAEGPTQQLNRLMEAMQLPKTAEMRDLLSFVIKNQLPITREGLLQAEALLQSVPQSMRAEALQAIHRMTELKLPFTEANFRSIVTTQSKEGLHDATAALRSLLMTDPTIPQEARTTMLSTLKQIAQPFTEATGNALLGQAVLTLLNQSESADTRFTIVQLLKNADILPPQTSLANLSQVLASLAMPEMEQDGGRFQEGQGMVKQLEGMKALISSQSGLTVQQRESLLSIVDRFIAASPTGKATNKIIQELTQTLLKQNAESAISNPFRSEGSPKDQLLTLFNQTGKTSMVGNLASLLRNVENSDHQLVQRMLQLAESSVAVAIEGKSIKDAMQTILRSMGMNYESVLLGKDVDIGRVIQSLKPQLLALAQDPNVSLAVRESAEQFIGRMNGPLLLSGENGVQHQLIMQVPLEFFGKKVEATLEWNGRMKEDGKIDADFARVLFYLDLHSLKETLIDMQVQNRVITITIFNDNRNLQEIGRPIQMRLKEGLESVGYQLSGVFFKDFVSKSLEIDPIKKEVLGEAQGVDFRI